MLFYTFLLGYLSVWWIYFSERGKIIHLGICSLLQGILLSIVIGEVHESRIIFVIGFTCGTMLSVWQKNQIINYVISHSYTFEKEKKL